MSLSREGSWWNPSFVRVWVQIQSSSLVFQTTQCSVSRRVSIELCLSWSSMESHDYIVFGARVPHQYSWSLETEGKKTGVNTAGSPFTLSSPYYDVPTWFSTKRGLNSAHVPENDGKMTKNSCNWICNLLFRGWKEYTFSCSVRLKNPPYNSETGPVAINVFARMSEGWEDSKFAKKCPGLCRDKLRKHRARPLTWFHLLQKVKVIIDVIYCNKWQRKYYWL